jgi:uncharacterized membrane protein
MDKSIIVIIPNETAAYEVFRALSKLDDEGSIELYSAAVVSKGPDGVVDVKDSRDRQGPWGTALGLSTGALIGLIAGPVGAAVGATLGGAAGLGGDLAYSGLQGDFVKQASSSLAPGAFAVCASIWEDWTEPVDAAVRPFGGVVLRQATEDLVVAQIRAETQALDEELAHLDAEIERAGGDAKAKLVAKREELRMKQHAQREQLEKRAEQLQSSLEAKIASIQAKAQSAKADAKARHEQRVEKLGRFAALQKQSLRELFS